MISIPALFHEIIDKCVEHEDDQNGNKDVVNCPNVTDLKKLPGNNDKTYVKSVQQQ